MGQISKQIFFKAPVEVVWKIWTDVEKTPEWVEGVLQSAIVSATKYGPGLEWEEKGFFGSTPVDMEHKMVMWEEKKKTVTRTNLPMGATMEKIAEFRSAGSESEVQIQVEWNLGVASMFLSDEKMAEMTEKSLNATAAKWKQRAETF
jgi:uncharacterized membrane protein